MKDKELFLETNFTFDNLISTKNQLIKNGWIIKSRNNKVTIYESKSDENYDDPICSRKDNTYVESLLNCFKEIKEYYKRVDY